VAVSECTAGANVVVKMTVFLLITPAPMLFTPDLKVTLPFSAVPVTVAVNVICAGATTKGEELMSVSVDAALALFAPPSSAKAVSAAWAVLISSTMSAVATGETSAIAQGITVSTRKANIRRLRLFATHIDQPFTFGPDDMSARKRSYRSKVG
jgi:hypothetical protein